MTAHRAQELNTSRMESFDSRGYLLTRYGLRMNKKEVCFEAKKSRATIDNMRNPRHRSFDRRLVIAQVEPDGEAETGFRSSSGLRKSPIGSTAFRQRDRAHLDTNSTESAMNDYGVFAGTWQSTGGFLPGICRPGTPGSYVINKERCKWIR